MQGENSCRGGTPFRIDSHHFCANKKVTASQDDGFVEGLKTSGWVRKKTRKGRKVTDSRMTKEGRARLLPTESDWWTDAFFIILGWLGHDNSGRVDEPLQHVPIL